ncbi:MAG: adenosine kinase [Leptospirales bacterium]|nr:adenosine kinase [Leptospirales bacterium]
MGHSNRKFDVFGVGNALVDTLAFVDESFLERHQLARGIMTLADSRRQGDLLHDLQDRSLELRSGGSAANTMWTLARLGGKAVYAGKVAADANGEFYRRDLGEAGIEFYVKEAAEDHGATGTCVVMTTPDSQRTMCTHLGVSTRLHSHDIDEERLKSAKFLYLEGYLWDAEAPRKACERAMEMARKHDVRVALTFSDPFCVERYRDEFRRAVHEFCDVVFCNADEARAFTGWHELDACIKELNGLAHHVFITNSGEGAFVAEGGTVQHVAGFPVKAVDTNGAGDAFAGGALFGLSQGRSSAEAARIGNYMGAQVVQIHGARLFNDYREHIKGILA